jgi:hypothetical protein
MPTVNSNLIYPIFAMFVLTVIVLCRMFLLRVKDLRTGEVKLSYFRTYTQAGGSEKMLQASRHFTNLFEVPVLFYVICILGMIFSEGHLFVIAAWLYVAARVAHAWIHMGSNNVMSRMRAYAAGWLLLIFMWGLFLYHQLVPAI